MLIFASRKRTHYSDMKTTKASEAAARLESLATAKKVGRGSIAYRAVRHLLTQEGEYRCGANSAEAGIDFRPTKTTGSGRYIKIVCNADSICSVLTLLGINYTIGNDSPRGGQTGKFITVTTKVRRA